MAITNWNRNQSNDLRDHFGRPLQIGQTVVKPTMSGRSAVPEIRTVAQFKNGKVYLDDSKVPINYSGRLVILEAPEESDSE
jgi:hypothetical protein